MKSRIWWVVISLIALGFLGIAIAAAAEPAIAQQVAGAVGPTGVNTWTKSGPMWDVAYAEAPQVIQILIDPSNPNIVYAGTNQGVYRSANGGETWEPRNGGLGGYGDLVISGIARHPTNPDILIIATWGYGLFRSTDAGRNWTRLTDPLATGSQAAAALPAGLPEVRAGGYSYSWGMPDVPEAVPGKPIAPGSADLLRRPADEQAIDLQGLPRSLSWTPVRRVAIHPTNPDEIYACIDAGGGLYRSMDGGANWSRVALGPPAGVITASARTYVFAPSNSAIRYASFGSWETSGGFYRTTDGGSSWTEVGGSTITRTVIAVAIHPTDPNIVLAGTSGGGLYRSTNGGTSWTLVSSGLADTFFFSVAFAPSNPSIVYAGGDRWIYRSANGGQTWTNTDSAFPTYYVEGLAIHPNQPDTVLVGANFFPWGGVYKRTGSTGPFALKATGMEDTFVLRIEQDPTNPNILYAATWGGGAFRSTNGGGTWSLIGGVPYIYDIEATSGPTCTIIYAATFYSDYGVLKRYMDGSSPWVEVSWGYQSDISFDIESLDGSPTPLLAATYEGVQYSTNGGQSWTTASGLNSGVVLKLAVSPTASNNVLAATYGGGVWRSTDSGRNWSESSSGLPAGGSSYVYDVAFAPGGITAYAATWGVYRSTNGGQSWSAAYTAANDWFRALDVASDGTVVAGSHTKGVYFGLGGGTSWMQRNSGLTELRIRAVKVLRGVSPLTAIAGTNGRSGWLYTLKLDVYLPLVLRSYPPPAWTVITSQDFEGAFPGPWQVFDDYPGYGEYYWGKRSCRPYAGSYSGWAVGGGANGAALSCGSNYPNYARSWMVYGPFSLVGATAAEMRFKLWIRTELNYDGVCWLASVDGTNFSGTCATGTAGWHDRVLNLANVPNLGNLLGRSSVWVALVFASDSSITYAEGAYVDNIVLRKCTVPGGGCVGGSALSTVEGGEVIEVPASLVLPRSP
jgi:photosystem II stability/assembly factor-like uncharacterized protein